MLRRGRTTDTARRRAGGPGTVLVALLVAAPIALTACSGGNSGNSAASNSDGGAARAPAAKAQGQANSLAGSGAAGAGGGTTSTSGNVQLPNRSLIITAGLQIKTDDAASAAQRATVIVESAGGYVAAESVGSGTQQVTPTMQPQSGGIPSDGSQSDTGTLPSPAQLPDVNGADQSTQALLELRVPPQKLDSVLGQLAGKGQVTFQSKSATDVTGQVADVSSRVDSARAAIAELRTLIDKAASMNDLISLEQALSQRESDLESLEAQQKALADQIQFATITVGYFSQGAAAAPPPVRTGFTRGLDVGWHSFTRVVRALLAAVGWLLPYAAVVIVLWWPVRRLVRWNRSRNRRAPAGAVLAPAGALLPQLAEESQESETPEAD